MIEVGMVFGRWTVTAKAPNEPGRRGPKWLTVCTCGKQGNVFQWMLLGGKSKSCGCYAADVNREMWKQNYAAKCRLASESSANASHRLSKHPAYQGWADMKGRCTKPQHRWYPSYGGRGITVHPEWLTSFESFWADMGATWFPKAQLGRINNDLGYSPQNCRWETAKQQQNNKSSNVLVVTPDGQMTIAQASEKYGLTFGCVSYRHKQGYSPSELVKPSSR